MRTRLALFISIFCISLSLFAQNKDSIAIVNAQWQITNIAKGVKLKQIHFTNNSLFNSNQFISILEISKKAVGKKKGFGFNVQAKKNLIPTSKIAEESEATAAINGSFFALNKPYNSVDYIRVNGEELAPNEYNGGDKRLFHQEGAVVINNGKLSILKPYESLTQDELLVWERTIKADDVMTSGPLLRIGGKDEVLKNTSHFTTRHPRTVVAKKSDGTILLITIDGRAKEAAGMSLSEVQSVFRWLGSNDILSLDGGGSTAMYIKGRGIVNHPTDNKIFDNKGERKVANAITLSGCF